MSIKCPHCFVTFHEKWAGDDIYAEGTNIVEWRWKATSCPSCEEQIIMIGKVKQVRGLPITRFDEDDSFLVYPKFPQRAPVSDDVPESFRVDYTEACNVLEISPKASAALSRRVLQGILRDKGYSSHNLVDQIKKVLGETNPQNILPLNVRNTIDAVRNFGNFAAHPMSDQATLQIIDVEPQEAEWCLEIIEALFEHYYVGPAESVKRVSALNQTLTKAGKPLMRQ